MVGKNKQSRFFFALRVLQKILGFGSHAHQDKFEIKKVTNSSAFKTKMFLLLLMLVCSTSAQSTYYPARACAARGKVISRGWCPVSIKKRKNLQFFWNQSFISQNTHFQSSISTQIGFSSNLMASGTA